MSQNFKKDFPLLMNDPVIYLDNGWVMWYNYYSIYAVVSLKRKENSNGKKRNGMDSKFISKVIQRR